jgi:hypothetical protein
VYSLSVEKYPGNPMMGRREIVDGKVVNRLWVSQTRFHMLRFVLVDWFAIFSLVSISYQAGKYTWVTYKEVYDTVLKVGASIRACGVGKVCIGSFVDIWCLFSDLAHLRWSFLFVITLGSSEQFFAPSQIIIVLLVFSIIHKTLCWLVAPWSSAGRTMWHLRRQFPWVGCQYAGKPYIWALDGLTILTK